ncbi:MAG: GAF and ANTAR domain-containing protein [Actinomycetota bacterium]|nr:GAF and ANTAR domain-containing protein [Actinomycetota bacterium]
MTSLKDHAGFLARTTSAGVVLQAAAKALVAHGADRATAQLAIKGTKLLLLVGHVGFDRSATDHFEVVGVDGMSTSCDAVGDGGEAVEVVDIATDPNFDETSRRVILEAGSRACISVPLVADGALFGVVTAHWDVPGEHDLPMVASVAKDTSKTLAILLPATEVREGDDSLAPGPVSSAALAEEVFGLRRALESRTVIAQATGLLMAQEGLTSEEAFHRLVNVSQGANVKLREIAERYVQSWEEHVRQGARG